MLARAQTVAPHAENATMAKARRIQSRLTGIAPSSLPSGALRHRFRYVRWLRRANGPAPSRARLVQSPLLFGIQPSDEYFIGPARLQSRATLGGASGLAAWRRPGGEMLRQLISLDLAQWPGKLAHAPAAPAATGSAPGGE